MYHKDRFHVEEELFVSNKTDGIAKIIDAKCKPADLKELTDNTSQLNDKQKEQLHTFLYTRRKSLYKIKLQDNVKPHHARLYSIPHAYKQTFKNEVEWSCKVEVLRKINRSE